MRINRPARTLSRLVASKRDFTNSGIATLTGVDTLICTSGVYNVNLDDWMYIKYAAIVVKGAAAGDTFIGMRLNAASTGAFGYIPPGGYGATLRSANKVFGHPAAGGWLGEGEIWAPVTLAGTLIWDLIGQSLGSNGMVAVLDGVFTIIYFRR